PGSVEEVAEATLVEIVGGDAGGHRAARRVDDLGAAAVVQRDVEEHPAVAGRLPNADLELALDVGRQLVGTADHLKLDVVLVEGAQLEPDVPRPPPHQPLYF